MNELDTVEVSGSGDRIVPYDRVRCDSLVCDPSNVRKHPDRNIEAIKASLLRFGQQKPIVVGKSGVVIAGNGTLMAARALGWDEIAVVRSTLDGSDATAFAIADNRTAELAEWDDEALASQLAALQIDDEALAEATGFDAKEIERLSFVAGEQDAEAQIDRADELQKEWGTETGQLWALGDHRLLCGDSTKAEDVDRCLGSIRPFLMVTDPPYGVDYEGGASNTVKRKKIEGDGSADLYSAAFLNCPCSVAYTWFAGSRAGQVYSAAMHNGFIPRAMIVWNKLKPHYGAASADYKQRHEPCLYSVRTPPSRFIGEMTEPTVWDIEQPRVNELHPTQKPIECMARPIRNHDAPEVYEPFSGSGTTIIACENLKRRCFAIEISPAYVAVALQRFFDATGKRPELVA